MGKGNANDGPKSDQVRVSLMSGPVFSFRSGLTHDFLTVSCDHVNHNKETFNCPSCSASKEGSLWSFGQLCDSQAHMVVAVNTLQKDHLQQRE